MLAALMALPEKDALYIRDWNRVICDRNMCPASDGENYSSSSTQVVRKRISLYLICATLQPLPFSRRAALVLLFGSGSGVEFSLDREA